MQKIKFYATHLARGAEGLVVDVSVAHNAAIVANGKPMVGSRVTTRVWGRSELANRLVDLGFADTTEYFQKKEDALAAFDRRVREVEAAAGKPLICDDEAWRRMWAVR